MNLGMGHVIYAGIYDLDGNPIVIERDALCTYKNTVDDIMSSLDHQMPKTPRKYHKYRTINGKPHIQLTYPLTNSSGNQAAVIEGLFAVSGKTIDEVVRRILRTAFEAISIVMLTTLILYPIITTLIRRLSTLTDSLLQANIETLRVLGSAVAKRDSDTDIHNYRVTIYSVKLAEAHGLHHNVIQKLIKGAFLHDVGKIGVSDQILLKPGKLTAHEFETMKLHVNYGIDIIRHSEWLKDASDVVRHHHEQFAGGGYPAGLTGDSIPITARIFAIADVFDALTSSRPYKEPMPFEDAMEILADGRNNHFDPSLLDTFTTIAKSLYEEVSRCNDQTLHQKLESITRQYFSKEMYSKS
ncbi:MAG: HD-GYP domain-containing protein [Deltaproteobacteria bacterium]|nr:HD-GYP domain-containing protein [Candidatus Anaeroferrophillus wilburensis]MBN2890155.1 HD-GYP domain-containing protein [Deltaproteobacteria bacterium]